PDLGVLPTGSVARRVEQEIRNRLGGWGLDRARGRVVRHQQDGVRRPRLVERFGEWTDDVAVPSLERDDLLANVTLMRGLVGRLDVQQEEVAVPERRQCGVPLRGVVVIEPGGGAGHGEDFPPGAHARRWPATGGFDASMSAMSCPDAAPTGKTAGFPVRSCGGTHSASPSSRGTTHRWRYSTPG